MRSTFFKLMVVPLLLAVVPASAQTYSPTEHLGYEAAVSEAVDDLNQQRVQDKRLIRERYREEVRLIRELYAQQVKGIKDRRALASYKRERDEKLRQAKERRDAINEASVEVLEKKFKDRKAYLRELPYKE